MERGLEEIMDTDDYGEQYTTANSFFVDADDTESDGRDQSMINDEMNESQRPSQIINAIVPQTVDSNLDFWIGAWLAKMLQVLS